MLNGSCNHRKYAIKLIENGAVSIILKFVTNDTLCDILLKRTDIKNQNLQKKFEKTIEYAIEILHNLSHTVGQTREHWVKSDATNILIKLSDKYQSKSSSMISIYLAIANIANDSEIDSLSKINEVLQDLTLIIKKFEIGMSSEELAERKRNRNITKIQLDEKNLVEVTQVIEYGISWNLIELLTALYNLTINDNLKKSIYFDCGIKDTLRYIIYNGNEVEAE
jgi:hypothetical protein